MAGEVGERGLGQAREQLDGPELGRVDAALALVGSERAGECRIAVERRVAGGHGLLLPEE